mmetsp:Transcript_28814/g.43516  ORF Transcript_28814/g.43516 Transcript_28814/m.43516 type:complete len:100 (+) Transcript_28814:1995-2294(+)
MSARSLLSQVGQSLEYLHENGIMLRNLDSSGILTHDDGQNVRLIISRLDRAINLGFDSFTSELYGDIRFRAPEVLEGKPYNFKADSWSFGVVLYFCLAG